MSRSVHASRTAALVGVVLLSACATTPRRVAVETPAISMPRRHALRLASLESHLTPKWISSATRIQAGDSVIYYRGTAQRASSEEDPWTGVVKGDILFLSRDRALLIPAGTLTLQAPNSIKVAGPSRTVVARPGESPPWRYLMAI